MTSICQLPRAQRGMAMIAALFMIIVVAALGVLAMRFGADQEQTANLELLTHRMDAAAASGLEYLSYQASRNDCINLPPSIPVRNETVIIDCVKTDHTVDASGFQRRAYDLTARAVHGIYGRPDYVQRSAFRRVGFTGALVPAVW